MTVCQTIQQYYVSSKLSLENGLLPEDIAGYKTNQKRRKRIKKKRKESLLGLRKPVRVDCIARRQDLTLKDILKNKKTKKNYTINWWGVPKQIQQSIQARQKYW